MPAVSIRLSRYMNPGASVASIATAAQHVTSCSGSAKASEILSMMLNAGFRRIPVVERTTGYFRGIITTADMLDFLGAGPKHEHYRKKVAMLDAPAIKIMETWVQSMDRKQSIARAIQSMRKQNVDVLPILHMKRFEGMVTERDILKNISGKLGIKVGDVMKRKPFFVQDWYPVFDVAKMLVHGPYRRLPVVKDGIVMGIATPLDILKHLNNNKMLRGLREETAPIRDAMNNQVVYAKPEERLDRVIERMSKNNVGGLPVVQGDEMDILGIITMRDVIDLLA